MNNYPDFESQQQSIDQRRKMAELLRSQTRSPQGQMVSGHYVAPSFLESLVPLANGMAGKYAMDQANQDASALNKEKNAALVDGLKQYQQIAQGTPAQTIQPATPNDDEGNAMPAAQVDAIPGSQTNAAQSLVGSNHPMLQELGIKQLVAGLNPKQAEGVVINGQLVDKYTGRPMGSVVPKQKEDYTLTPGGVRFGADGQKIAEVGDFNKPINSDGTPNLGYQRYEFGKAKAGATNITNKVDVKTGESLAKEVGGIMTGASESATAASNQVAIAQRLKQSIDSNKLFTGTGANLRLSLAQVADTLGVGGKDTQEKIANTRQAVQSLAQLTLEGRKQMKGQGAVTESESKLAERAASGDIDLTPTELKILANAAERSGRSIYSNYERKFSQLKSDPSTQQLAPYYEAQPLPEPTQAPAQTGGFKILGVR